MKKLFLGIIFLLIFCQAGYCNDNDLWDNWNANVPGIPNTENVTDEEFEKAFEKVDKKVNRWKHWAEKLKKPKGSEFSQSNESDVIETQHGDKSTLPVLLLPVEVKFADGIIPVGHYQVKGEIIDSKPTLSLYQASYLIARIPATETDDDFSKDEILFVDWIEEDSNRLKVIYGSLDFNAYTYLDIYKHNSDDY